MGHSKTYKSSILSSAEHIRNNSKILCILIMVTTTIAQHSPLMSGTHYYGYDRPFTPTVYSGTKMAIKNLPFFYLIFIGSDICSHSCSVLIAIPLHRSDTNQSIHSFLQTHTNIKASIYGQIII